MDAKAKNAETAEESEQEQTQIQAPLSHFPTASVSFSHSTLLPSHFLPPIQITDPPNKIKIPSQSSSLFHFFLSSSLSPRKPFFKSTISSDPLHLLPNPLRPSNPSGAADLRRAAVVWFRNDLRIHDNECLTVANNESIAVLPVYCLDPRDYGNPHPASTKRGPIEQHFL